MGSLNSVGSSRGFYLEKEAVKNLGNHPINPYKALIMDDLEFEELDRDHGLG